MFSGKIYHLTLCLFIKLGYAYMILHVQSTLAEVVKKLKRQVIEGEPFDMIVRRAHVLEDALRRATRSSFDPARSIVVSLHSNTESECCYAIHN